MRLFNQKTKLSVFLMATLSITFAACSNDDENNNKTNSSADEPKEYVETDVLDANGDIALPTDYTSIKERSNDFSWKIFGQTLSNENNNNANIVVSPYSLAVDLAMLNNGANGKTQQEIINALGFDGFSADDINDYFAILTRGLVQTDATFTITEANGMWYDQLYTMKKSFLSVLNSWYKAETNAADMNSDQTLNDINSWISDKTNGLVDRMFEDKSELPDVMTLINTIYVNSPWTYPFDERFTRDGLFTLSDGTSKTVPFMNHGVNCLYYSDNKTTVTFLSLGENEKFDMFFALPAEGMSLSSLTDYLSSTWSSVVANANLYYIGLALPKFTSSYDTNLKSQLYSLGCNRMFSQKDADFSNMTDVDGIYVNDIKQKSKIKIDESGIECASATAILMVGAGDEEIPQVDLTRPFVYGLRNKATGVILFVGVVNDPTLE